jgi:hypothetical protein
VARSVGAAAAAGLESGLGLGLRMRDQELQEQDIARRSKQQDEDRAYLTEERTRKRQQEDDDGALKAIEAQYEALRGEGEGLFQQYGGLDKVPKEVAGPYSQRVAEVTGARASILEKRYRPLVQKREQDLANLVSRLQTNQVSIEDVPDGDLYRALTTAARRDPKDLLAAEGAPSRVGQAVTDVMTGLETRNEQMMLSGANVLLEPELKVGIGETSPHGGKIVAKEIIRMIPDPQREGHFMPVVKVYVSKGKDFRGPVPDGVPQGATGYYIAPITENRSSDPEDAVKSIDLNKAMDYAAKMQTLSSLLSQPGMREKLERGAAEAAQQPDDFLTAFYAVKGRMPEKKVEWKSVPPGGLVGVDAKTGKPTGDRFEGTPRAAGGLQTTAEGIDRLVDEGVLSPDEGLGLKRDAARRQATGLRKGGGGSSGGKGGGGGSVAANGGLGGYTDADMASMAERYVENGVKPSFGQSRAAQPLWARFEAAVRNVSGTRDVDPRDVGKVGSKSKPPAEVQRMNIALRSLDQGLVAYEQKLKSFNPRSFDQASPEARAEIASLVADLRLQLKEAQALGALTGPDIGLLDKMLADPTSLKGAVFGTNGLTKQLGEVRASLERRKNALSLEYASRTASSERAKGAESAGGLPRPSVPGAALASAPAARTATNPRTGEKLILKDGQWVPLK